MSKKKPLNLIENVVQNSLEILKGDKSNSREEDFRPKGPFSDRPLSTFLSRTKSYKPKSPLPKKPLLPAERRRKKKPFLTPKAKSKLFETSEILSFTKNTPTPLLLEEMNQEFLLAHLVLVSVPLLFTGREY